MIFFSKMKIIKMIILVHNDDNINYNIIQRGALYCARAPPMELSLIKWLWVTASQIAWHRRYKKKLYLNKIFVLQKRAIHAINNLAYNEHANTFSNVIKSANFLNNVILKS